MGKYTENGQLLHMKTLQVTRHYCAYDYICTGAHGRRRHEFSSLGLLICTNSALLCYGLCMHS